ncbi:hypothetical protein [Bacillus sp. T33-2]|nr:hypothetical protein [Bacillus sp. T33-2]
MQEDERLVLLREIGRLLDDINRFPDAAYKEIIQQEIFLLSSVVNSE